MSWWGKALGGAFGFMIGGPLGALMGIAFGHSFDRGLGKMDGAEWGRRSGAHPGGILYRYILGDGLSRQGRWPGYPR